MIHFQIQDDAIADIEQAASWYEAEEAGLGTEFILELDSAIDRIKDNPDHYEIIYSEVRRVLLRRFPYSIYFVSNNKTIEIIAVLHQRITTSTWQSRV